MTESTITQNPKRMRQIGGGFYWRPSRTLTKLGYRSIPLGHDKESAIARARDLNATVNIQGNHLLQQEASRKRRRIVLGEAYMDCYRRAQKRSREIDRPFTLTEEELLQIADRAEGRCEVTKIEFDLVKGDTRRRPFSPSLDRIDCRQGYHLGNCRLVCAAVNLAIADFGDAIFRRICYAMIAAEGDRLARLSGNK